MNAEIQYNPGSGAIGLDVFADRGGLIPMEVTRGNDNLSSSGAVRERVVENTDVILGFTQAILTANGTLETWSTWARWAQQGNSFRFYPVKGGGTYYNVVLEDMGWTLKRIGIGRYTAAVKLRVLQDGQAPANAGSVLHKYWGY